MPGGFIYMPEEQWQAWKALLHRLLDPGCVERAGLTWQRCFWCEHPLDDGEAHEPGCPYSDARAFLDSVDVPQAEKA